MIQVRQTPEFAEWLSDLTDRVAQKRIAQRLARLQIGLFGDAKPVGGRILELRVDHGPGYRIYLARRGPVVVLLLCGGTKGSQRRDIGRARKIEARFA